MYLLKTSAILFKFIFLCTKNVLKSDPKSRYSKIISLLNIIHFYIELHNNRVQIAPIQATTTRNNLWITLNTICFFQRLQNIFLPNLRSRKYRYLCTNFCKLYTLNVKVSECKNGVQKKKYSKQVKIPEVVILSTLCVVASQLRGAAGGCVQGERCCGSALGRRDEGSANWRSPALASDTKRGETTQESHGGASDAARW